MYTHGLVRTLAFTLLFAVVVPAVARSEDRLRGSLTSSPEAVRIGSEFRVTGIVFNGAEHPQRISVSIYTIRPWGEHIKLGEKIVELRPRERKTVVIPCVVPRQTEPGLYSIGMVIRSEHGRFIADTKVMRILPAVEPALPR